MTTRVRACKRLLHRMTSKECEGMLQYIRPSIVHLLNEDVLRLICEYLHTEERLAFLYALLYRNQKTHWNRFPTLIPLFLRDYAHRTMVWHINRIAESLHFIIPQRGTSVGIIACNWTPFSSSNCAPLAYVYWSQVYPHARVELVMQHVRQVVNRNLAGIRPVVRLTAHCTNHRSGVNVRMCAGQYVRLAVLPEIHQDVDLLASSGIPLTTLYRKRVRHMIANDSLKSDIKLFNTRERDRL